MSTQPCMNSQQVTASVLAGWQRCISVK